MVKKVLRSAEKFSKPFPLFSLPLYPSPIPWKLKPGFINRVFSRGNFWGLEMPLEIVFLEPQNWRPLKPHY